MPPSNSIGRIRALLTGVLLLSPEQAVDLLADLTIGHLDIILGVTIIVHEGEETIVRDIELQKMSGQSHWPEVKIGDRVQIEVLLCRNWGGGGSQAGTRDERRWGHPCCAA